MAIYDDTIREQARLLYQQVGSRRASEQLRIPQRTIQQWASTERWATRLASVNASGEEHAQRIRAGWALRRQGLADDAADASGEILDMLRERVKARKVYGIRDLAHAFSLLTERAAEMSAAGAGSGDGVLPAAEAVDRLVGLVDAVEGRVGTDG